MVGNLMEIKEKNWGLLRNIMGNHQNHQNKQNHPNHQKSPNLIEIKGNGRECPRATLPKTTKTTKTSKHNQNHQNHLQKLANLMQTKGIDRGCPNQQNHQNKQTKTTKNHQKHQNLMDEAWLFGGVHGAKRDMAYCLVRGVSRQGVASLRIFPEGMGTWRKP